MLLAKTEQMRAIEEAAVKEQGIRLYDLMERAGAAAAAEARIMAPEAGRISIVCGKGNNGGDGFVAARLLAADGYQVEIIMLSDPGELKGEAAEAFSKIADNSSIPKKSFEAQIKAAQTEPGKIGFADADLIIDAIFGFGLTGAARGSAADAIKAVNLSGAPVLAVDIPSGIESDTGQTPGEVVRADITVTFTAPKAGMAIEPGRELCGSVRVADIGIDKDIIRRYANVCLGSRAQVRPLLPRRSRMAHKGECGRVLVVAGSVGMTGAAALAAEAALRIGAGLVTLAVPASLNDILEVKLTEVMTKPLPETAERTVAIEAFDTLMETAPDFDVMLIGPGLSANESTAKLVRKLAVSVSGPMVIDADGLNSLVGQTELLNARPGPTILTPHPGELGRLLGAPADTVQADRLGAAENASKRWDTTVVLKGAGTVISGGGCLYINPTGNPGMATAGTGDVLGGMIAGLTAQGLPAYPAAVLGAYLHGYSGDLAAAELSELALTAGDLLDYLSAAITDLQDGRLDKDGGE